MSARSTSTRKQAVKKPEAESPPAQKGSSRGRLIAILVSVGLIAAAYGGGRLQGALALRAAKAEWQKEQTRLSDSLEARTRELSTLKAQQALWRLSAGLSEVLSDIADKNYGLARDAAGEMSALLSRTLPDMDGPSRERLQPLVTLLAETGQAADTLSPDTRAKAQQARTLVLQALAQPAGQQSTGQQPAAQQPTGQQPAAPESSAPPKSGP
jgi:hypothetical protein